MQSPRIAQSTNSSAFLQWRSLTLLLLLFLIPGIALSVGDASTRFQIFVPANNDKVGRDVALIVTNVSPLTTTVDIIDTPEDGDDDDTARGVRLAQGQSWVRFIKDGAVNDDAGGKWDGDYFQIESEHPVVVQMATRSDWQWDFAPADNKTMRGQSFFLYSPATSFSQRDLNLVAYEDDTEVQVLDITVSPLNASGITTVNLETPVEVLKAVLNEGEDLISRRGLGIDIFDPGRSYWVRSSKGVTCQYGSLVGNARDGGGFVPSENGFASGEKFYFHIPRDNGDEREVRIVSFDDDNSIQLAGWDRTAREWVTFREFELDRFGHGDWVESGTDYGMYRLLCSPGKKVSVFVASWLEAKGLSGTKDIASFPSSESGYGAGREFLFYVPQPGVQGNLRWNGQSRGNASMLYVFGHIDGTQVRVIDADTNGSLFSKTATVGRGGFVDIRMSPEEFNTLNRPAQGIRPYLQLEASHLVTVMVSNHNDNWMTFVPSVVLPNPILTVVADKGEALVGDEVCLRIEASNEGAGVLSNAALTLPLDPAAVYVSSTFSIPGLGAPQLETDPVTGGQIARWSGFTIPADGALVGDVCVEIQSRRPDNSVVRNRDFLSFPVLVSGDGFGIPVEIGGFEERFTAQSSAVLTVDDAAQTNVSGLAATSAGRNVNVTWQTGREPDLIGFQVYRSNSGDGPFTLLNQTAIPGRGDAITGDRYQFTDTPPTLGATYYYRLQLILDGGGTARYGPVAVTAEDRTPPLAPVALVSAVADSQVTLQVSGGNEDGDLKGYAIFRSTTAGGVYTRLNELLLPPGVPYVDRAVNNGTTYFYRARAVDESGNTSDFSNTVSAELPSRVDLVHTVAFEDQIGPSKNDWDYNDWVSSIVSEERFSAGGVSSVSMEIECLARGARFTNAFRMRYRVVGNWTAQISVLENRSATEPLSTRTESGSGVADLLLFEDTVDALPPEPGEDFTNTLNRQNPARPGQIVRISLTIESPAANPSANRHRAPFGPYLVNQAGEVHQRREGFPDSTEVVTFWPESPLLGYHLDYVMVVPGREWYWPLENQKIWDAYPSRFATHYLSGRIAEPNWWLSENRNPARTYNWYNFSARRGAGAAALESDKAERLLPEGEFIASLGTNVSVAPKAIRSSEDAFLPDSLLLAGANETVFATDPEGNIRDGWPLHANSFRAAPAIVRLARTDLNLSMITAEERYEAPVAVEAWDLGTTPSLRWRAAVEGAVKSPPVIADLDGDGLSEVLVLTATGDLAVFGSDGEPHAASPLSLGRPAWNAKSILSAGGPVVVDIDGDGLLEVFVVGPSCEEVFGFDSSLEPLRGWPRALPGPSVGGVTAAHHPVTGQIALYSATSNGYLVGWDVFGRAVPGFPVELGGNFTTPVIAFAEFEELLDTLVLADANGVVHLLGTNGAARDGWPRETGEEVLAPPVVGDLNGDAEMNILLGTASGSVYTWTLDGALVENMCFQTSGVIQASPLLADFDQDARVEAYVVTAGGDLFRGESAGQTPLPLYLALGWAGVGGGGESNAPVEDTWFQAAPMLVESRAELVGFLLGMNNTRASVEYDVNLDGRVDSADLQSLPQ